MMHYGLQYNQNNQKTTELLEELHAENLEEIQKRLSSWWNNEDIDTDELQARGVSIHTKGDMNKFKNH